MGFNNSLHGVSYTSPAYTDI